jgi:hypothetical protein
LKTEATCQPSKIQPEREKETTRPKRGRKRGGGRKEEPRRKQNIAAQKKYRDKRANTANLVSCSTRLTVHTNQQMSRYIIRIRRALNNRTTVSSMKCLVNVYRIVDEYRESVKSELIDHLQDLRLIV